MPEGPQADWQLALSCAEPLVVHAINAIQPDVVTKYLGKLLERFRAIFGKLEPAKGTSYL